MGREKRVSAVRRKHASACCRSPAWAGRRQIANCAWLSILHGCLDCTFLISEAFAGPELSIALCLCELLEFAVVFFANPFPPRRHTPETGPRSRLAGCENHSAQALLRPWRLSSLYAPAELHELHTCCRGPDRRECSPTTRLRLPGHLATPAAVWVPAPSAPGCAPRARRLQQGCQQARRVALDGSVGKASADDSQRRPFCQPQRRPRPPGADRGVAPGRRQLCCWGGCPRREQGGRLGMLRCTSLEAPTTDAASQPCSSRWHLPTGRWPTSGPPPTADLPAPCRAPTWSRWLSRRWWMPSPRRRATGRPAAARRQAAGRWTRSRRAAASTDARWARAGRPPGVEVASLHGADSAAVPHVTCPLLFLAPQVYDFENWRQHRSTKRYMRHAKGLLGVRRP